MTWMPPPHPVALSGGNPQVPKGDGEAPVRYFIEHMPGWQQNVGAKLDALIEQHVPGVQKAVRWNTPFYGVPDQGWFLGFHCFAKYVKITFLRGSALNPLPPVASKDSNVRYLHIEESGFDDVQLAAWIRQAAAAPGDPLF